MTDPKQYGAPFYNSDEQTWTLVSHFGGAAGAFLFGGCGGWVAPLIALLAHGNRSPYVRAEAIKALNFQLLWSIVGLIGYATLCVGIGVVVSGVAWLAGTILGVIAGVKAANREPFTYPFSVTIIK
ncbi:DUF4870 domain-containing protein [Actinoplanes sp. NPDC051851]|uniref:DUF4870 domain-containing protein n=1 Tax=Actinoplanes sp. NPDC051851 TaxID=3154753 RepID=UPI003438CD29